MCWAQHPWASRASRPCYELLVVRRVSLEEVVPFIGKIVLLEDRLHRALIHAQAAIDAVFGVDVQHLGAGKIGFIFRRMNAVRGAHGNACGVFDADAR